MPAKAATTFKPAGLSVLSLVRVDFKVTARKSDTEQPTQAIIHREKPHRFGNIGYLSDFQTGQTVLDKYLFGGLIVDLLRRHTRYSALELSGFCNLR